MKMKGLVRSLAVATTMLSGYGSCENDNSATRDVESVVASATDDCNEYGCALEFDAGDEGSGEMIPVSSQKGMTNSQVLKVMQMMSEFTD